METSNSDDQPLAKRLASAHTKADAGKRSNSGSPLPDWLSENNSPVKTLELLSDSDEVLEIATSDDGGDDEAGPGPGSAAAQKQASKKRAREAAPQGRRRVKRMILSSDNDDSDEGDGGGNKGQQSAQKRKTAVVATQQSQMLSSQNSAGPSQTTPLKRPGGSGSRKGLAKIPEDDEQPDDKAEAEGTQAVVGSQAAKGPKLPVSKAAVLAPVAGEVPVMMPEKLPLTKFIVELEGGNDSSVDLTGDAGVVGRWLVEGDKDNPELKLDLKGVVYAATTVPCATTLCVVNLSATEARVEALSQQYIQLRPLGAQNPSGDNDADDNYFMYDDDDNYQYEGNSQHPGPADEAGPSGKGAKKKPKAAAAGKAKKPPAKRAGAGGKPAKKKPAAGKAKAKK